MKKRLDFAKDLAIITGILGVLAIIITIDEIREAVIERLR